MSGITKSEALDMPSIRYTIFLDVRSPAKIDLTSVDVRYSSALLVPPTPVVRVVPGSGGPILLALLAVDFCLLESSKANRF